MTAVIKLAHAITSLNSNAKYRYLHDANDSSKELIDTKESLDVTTPISNADILADEIAKMRGTNRDDLPVDDQIKLYDVFK